MKLLYHLNFALICLFCDLDFTNLDLEYYGVN